jgi:hypothetical protein
VFVVFLISLLNITKVFQTHKAKGLKTLWPKE